MFCSVPQNKLVDSYEEKVLRIVRTILLTIVLLLAGAACSAWLGIYRALPQTDGTVTLDGLSKPVTVDRDNWGVPHIRANSLEDLVEAQGYVAAQDRLWQMDVLRRFGAGELSEIFGQAALPIDEEFRRLGLRQVAERDATTLSGDDRMVLEAYARGVNRFIEGHQYSLPVGVFPAALQTQAVDARGFHGDPRIHVPDVDHRVAAGNKSGNRFDARRPNRVAEMYAEDSPDDRVVVGAEPQTNAKPEIALRIARKLSGAASRTSFPETAAA